MNNNISAAILPVIIILSPMIGTIIVSIILLALLLSPVTVGIFTAHTIFVKATKQLSLI